MMTKQTISQILSLQSERAKNYHAYQASFKSYLESRDHQAFNQAVELATGKMQSLSAQMRAIGASLTEEGRSDIASKIKDIQEEERLKLQMTLTVQKLQQSLSWQTFSWQQPIDPDEDPLEPRMGCGCSHSHAEGESHSSEPTEIEVTNALKEAVLSLDSTNARLTKSWTS